MNETETNKLLIESYDRLVKSYRENSYQLRDIIVEKKARIKELEELYSDLDQRKLAGIILELTIENIDLKKQLQSYNVRQLSELLKAYESMLLNSGDLTQEIKDQDRDDFIKAFNCR